MSDVETVGERPCNPIVREASELQHAGIPGTAKIWALRSGAQGSHPRQMGIESRPQAG